MLSFRHSLVFALSLSAALSAAHGSAWASKAKRTPEVYSSIDEEASVRQVAQRRFEPVFRKNSAEQPSRASYDPVPSDQVKALTRRLQLVETLVRRHGRAYDYRLHTVKELETLLARLDRAATPPQATPEMAPAALPTPSEAEEMGGEI